MKHHRATVLFKPETTYGTAPATPVINQILRDMGYRQAISASRAVMSRGRYPRAPATLAIDMPAAEAKKHGFRAGTSWTMHVKTGGTDDGRASYYLRTVRAIGPRRSAEKNVRVRFIRSIT